MCYRHESVEDKAFKTRLAEHFRVKLALEKAPHVRVEPIFVFAEVEFQPILRKMKNMQWAVCFINGGTSDSLVLRLTRKEWEALEPPQTKHWRWFE